MAPARAWIWQGRCLGLLCLAAPVPQMFVPGSGLFVWIGTGDMVGASVDTTLMATGLLAMGVTTRMKVRLSVATA